MDEDSTVAAVEMVVVLPVAAAAAEGLEVDPMEAVEMVEASVEASLDAAAEGGPLEFRYSRESGQSSTTCHTLTLRIARRTEASLLPAQPWPDWKTPSRLARGR